MQNEARERELSILFFKYKNGHLLDLDDLDHSATTRAHSLDKHGGKQHKCGLSSTICSAYLKLEAYNRSVDFVDHDVSPILNQIRAHLFQNKLYIFLC